MAPKSKAQAKTKPSASRDLITTGPKEVVHSRKRRLDKQGNPYILPTTSRALVLRNGKAGARGTGEVVLVSKLTGREKLDLLAEDLINKAKTALGVPFRLKECERIAESQTCYYLDDITNLQDPDLFASIIEGELKARVFVVDKADDQSRNPSFIAKTVANRIHNTYLLASAWRIVADSLIELGESGISDHSVVTQLANDEELRSRYLVVFDMVNKLVDLAQAHFSVLATTTPHYAKYFKRVENENETEYIFDWQDLKNAARSFLDSIIIELCFPRAPYPRGVLFEILHDAVEESPKESKRFPQQLWDAVGDLSFCVELQKILEAPLLTPQGQTWKDIPRTMPVEYERWIDAQVLSLQASEKIDNYKDVIYPLAKTKSGKVLENMWKYVNLNYKSISGHDIDSLWQLEDALLNPAPQWHTVRLRLTDDILDMDDDSAPSGKKKKRAPLAITAGGDDTDDGMPELQDVSDSSNDEFSDSEDDDVSSDGGDESEDSGYDTDQEDEMREMLREAMDTATDGDWFRTTDEDDDAELEDRKGNPFLKLLGSLRGRMFNSSSKLKTAGPTKKPDPSKIPKLPKVSRPKPKTATGPNNQKTTIEEEEDEDDVSTAAKKKKKKPKKKKKKTAGTTDAGDAEGDAEAEVPEEPVVVASEPAPAPAPKASAPKAASKTPASPPKAAAKPAVPSIGSTLSLPIEQTTVQSARSYLKAENLDDPKVKVKTRNEGSTLMSKTMSKTKGLISKFGFGGKEKKVDEKVEEPAVVAMKRRNWFGHLNKRKRELMHQLLNTSEDVTRGTTGMKWDNFVTLMKDMGFTFDPSTAGSSVRFDPPDPKDRAISFHKPHPDPSIDRVTLKLWSKKLQKYYGWRPEDVMT
ncbi:hypothetical protein C8J56DRAFT_1012387 [Mycena floridula]|nr:hypothetical protein C8J56DRAFT_1012387 [Mycena floridula]